MNSIYSYISAEKLHDILQTLQSYTRLPLQLIAADGVLLRSFGGETGFCSLFKKTALTENSCLSLHVKSGQIAQNLGETYIFSCHANLTHIAFPLCGGESLLGSVILGPFLMDSPDSSLVGDIAERYTLPPARSLELYDELLELQVIPPSRVRTLKKLVDYLLSPLIPGENEVLMQSREKLYQQSRINETIQRYKGREISSGADFLFQKEKELLDQVRLGSVPKVKELLNDLLGYVLFSRGAEIEAVRHRAVELTALLSRVSVDGGAPAEIIYDLTDRLLPSLYAESDLDTLCLKLQEIAESFMSAMFVRQDKGNRHIRRALGFMAEHYGEHIELSDAAKFVGLSPGYFSTLFCSTVGVSFREQLSLIRVEKSKQLLLATDSSLADIAAAVGFPDQSYFCKVFKRLEGVSPGKFRR